MALTAKKVEKLKQPGRYGDGHGLYLQVQSPTNKSWLLRFERGGVERWMGLGPTHTFTLAEARERARKARQLLADGIDPIEHRLAERDARLRDEAANITFQAAAEKYIALHEDGWRNAKHRQQWRNTLKDYAFPTLGGRPVKAIDAPVINAALAPIWLKTPETGRRVKNRIEKVCSWVKEGMPLPARNGAQHRQGHAALPYRDLPIFMASLRERNGLAARGLEFLILTASRSGEVLGAKWEEIDLKHRTWTVPASRMKSAREHRVPLSDRAIEILEALPHERANAHLFIGGRKGKGLGEAALRQLLDMARSDVTVHGFRSSFRTWAAECTAFPHHVCEAALAHVIPEAVVRSYQRGDLLEKRRRLMAEWARYCATKPSEGAGANVVALQAER
jgi:integrase